MHAHQSPAIQIFAPTGRFLPKVTPCLPFEPQNLLEAARANAYFNS
ncbi:hypothetical protein PAMC26510_13285 [Caballeronia sordidicola]|uniref:Uncharacterized protein n=1 Tax=Caballeronia sordidicola TaxID=196367 RepID=A0A242MWG3_CABSO|nr:hypothetical protein PAMC26510_13285 [Caballeronia sordidicola]